MTNTPNEVTRYDGLSYTYIRAGSRKGEAFSPPPCLIPHTGNEDFHGREGAVAPDIEEGKLLDQWKEPISSWNPRP